MARLLLGYFSFSFSVLTLGHQTLFWRLFSIKRGDTAPPTVLAAIDPIQGQGLPIEPTIGEANALYRGLHHARTGGRNAGRLVQDL